MPVHEVYQVYNRQQKQWVKMRNGRILENDYFKFEGVPVFGKGPEAGPPADASQEEAQDDKPAETLEDSSTQDSMEDDEGDSFGFMDYF